MDEDITIFVFFFFLINYYNSNSLLLILKPITYCIIEFKFILLYQKMIICTRRWISANAIIYVLHNSMKLICFHVIRYFVRLTLSCNKAKVLVIDEKVQQLLLYFQPLLHYLLLLIFRHILSFRISVFLLIIIPTIYLIFIVIITTFWQLCPSTFFWYLMSNSRDHI